MNKGGPELKFTKIPRALSNVNHCSAVSMPDWFYASPAILTIFPPPHLSFYAYHTKKSVLSTTVMETRVADNMSFSRCRNKTS